MRKPLLALALALALLASGASADHVSAATPQLDSADVIQGMGERVPAGKKNVSLSPLFKVYTFEKAGLTFAQLNSLKDELITVITVTAGVQSRLPIGTAAKEPMLVINDAKGRPLGRASSAANCPCNASVVYQDAYTTIVVVYGADGAYITSDVIPRTEVPPEAAKT